MLASSCVVVISASYRGSVSTQRQTGRRCTRLVLPAPNRLFGVQNLLASGRTAGGGAFQEPNLVITLTAGVVDHHAAGAEVARGSRFHGGVPICLSVFFDFPSKNAGGRQNGLALNRR